MVSWIKYAYGGICMFGINKESKEKKKQQKLEELYTKASGLTKQSGESFQEFEARVKMKDAEIKEESQKKINAAEQMYQYCIDNNYGSGMNRTWGVKHFLLIEQALQPDEEVKMCFIGLHNYVSPSKHDNNFAYAITNKRIIMAQQKVVGQNFQSVAYSNLNDITLSTGMVYGIITIDTYKETFNIALDKISAKKINDKVHEILFSVRQSKSVHAQTQTVSSADEILKYKNLLDMGAITQAEYEKKKKELL